MDLNSLSDTAIGNMITSHPYVVAVVELFDMDRIKQVVKSRKVYTPAVHVKYGHDMDVNDILRGSRVIYVCDSIEKLESLGFTSVDMIDDLINFPFKTDKAFFLWKVKYDINGGVLDEVNDNRYIDVVEPVNNQTLDDVSIDTPESLLKYVKTNSIVRAIVENSMRLGVKEDLMSDCINLESLDIIRDYPILTDMAFRYYNKTFSVRDRILRNMREGRVHKDIYLITQRGKFSGEKDLIDAFTENVILSYGDNINIFDEDSLNFNKLLLEDNNELTKNVVKHLIDKATK